MYLFSKLIGNTQIKLENIILVETHRKIKMKKTTKLLTFVTLIIVLSITCSAYANDKVSGRKVFEKLKTLVGTWQKEGAENLDFNITFEQTANKTVLIETWNRKGKKHSLTLYHLNGDALIATHYCPQGNQPRLQLSKESKLNDFTFDFWDATNLKNLNDSHQHFLNFELSGLPNRILRKESYLSGSGESPSELELVRIQK